MYANESLMCYPKCTDTHYYSKHIGILEEVTTLQDELKEATDKSNKDEAGIKIKDKVIFSVRNELQTHKDSIAILDKKIDEVNKISRISLDTMSRRITTTKQKTKHNIITLKGL